MAKPSFIAFEQKTPRGVDIASPQEGKITIFDFKEGREYRASNGSVMKILSVTDSGRFLIFLKDTLEGVTENDSNKRYTEVQLRELVVKHGFVLSAETSVSAKHPVPEPATETTSPKVVVDMGVARGQRGMEPVPVKLEQQNALFSEIEGLTREIVSALEDINSKMKAIWAVLEEVEEDATVEAIRTQAREALQRAGDLSKEDDAADDEQKGKAFTREYIDAKRKRLEELQNIFVQLVALSSDIEVQEAAVVEAGAPVEVTMTAGGKSDAVVPGSGEGAPADKKPRAPRRGKGGGSGDGGDGTGDDKTNQGLKPTALKPKNNETINLTNPVSEPVVVPMGAAGEPKDLKESEIFDTVFKASQEQVGGLITGMTTAEDYIKFRQEMVVIPSEEADRPPRRYIFSLKKIREALGREMSVDERTQFNGLQEGMEKLAREKFFELKRADLRSASMRWREEINKAEDIAAIDALAEAWSRELAIPAVWAAGLKVLNEFENKIIENDFSERFAEFKGELQEKRATFLADQDTSWRQELDVFQKHFGRAVEVYRGVISSERTRFLEAAFSNKDLTDKIKGEIWEKELLPKIREGILDDIVSRGNLERAKAEEVMSAILKVLDKERAERMKQEKEKRQARNKKPTT
ncbi:MAG: hypothetical protein WA082_00210 [Candidatus Moraniibacteriota bacterium]